MSDINIYRSTPRGIRAYIIDAIQAGLVPLVKSSPGMGKSTIMHGIANEYGLKMIDHRLSTSAPEDLSGLPEFYDVRPGERRARFVPFGDLFPLEGDPLPVTMVDGQQVEMNGWMLFLDELTSAKKDIQAPSYKLILDKMTGQKRLHEACVITAAGNLATDRAIVNEMSSALQSRLVHLEMELSHREWMEDVALAQHWDSRLIAYLSQYPSKLMDFNPKEQGTESTFCCPRTWEFMNKLILGKEVSDEKIPLYAGTITSGVAVDFVRFTKVAAHMVSITEILNDPATARIPDDLSAKWATITHLMEKIKPDNADQLLTYVSRFPVDFRVLFFRAVIVRHPEIHATNSFRQAMVAMGQYLFS